MLILKPLTRRSTRYVIERVLDFGTDREVRRNRGGDHSPSTATTAQRIADQHERQRTRKTLEKDPTLRAHVVAELRQDCSPEQIAGCLREQPALAQLVGKYLCAETIYQYIDAGEGRFA